MSIESVMPFNRLILCCPLFLLPSIIPSIRVFSNESVLRITWPKYWSFSFSISPSNEYSRLTSFRIDWLDLLAVQGTLKSLLQYHSSVQFSSFQSLSRVWLFATLWTAVCQASLSITNSRSKASVLQCTAFFIAQLSHPYITPRKTIALTRWTSVGKVMSLLFNMLSRLVIAFLPRSKRLLISWLQSPSAVILELQKVILWLKLSSN